MTAMPFRTLALLLALTVPGVVPAAVEPTPEQIGGWVRDLGADDFAAREEASARLWKAGRAAEAAVTRAAASEDLETARRARDLLVKFRWGIYPDTPAEVVALIDRYRRGDQSARRQAVRDLFAKGRPGFAAVGKFIELEKDPNEQNYLKQQVAREGWRLARALVAEGDLPGAEKFLDAGLPTGEETVLRHHAAFHLLRGTAGKKAAELRERLGGEEDPGLALALVYLCRARGDLDGALWAARKAGRADVVRSLLDEKGDWKAVADALAEDSPRKIPRQHTLRATFLRLAGDREGFQEEVRRLSDEKSTDHRYFFFFNGMTDRAVALLREQKSLAGAFEVLEEQGTFREALELKLPEGADPGQRFSLDVRRARLLIKLGEEKKGKELFAALAGQIGKDAPEGQAGQLLKAAREAGGVEEALPYLGRFLVGDRPPENPSPLFRAVFPDHADPAEFWWEVLGTAYPKEDTAARLRRLREVFEQHKAGPDFVDLARRAEKGAPSAQRLARLAQTCEVVGQDDLAREYWDRAARKDAEFQIQLGDFHARKERWEAAAGAYRLAWERDRQDVTALYLRGRSLVRAGKEKEGRALLDQARLLPLADEAQRYTLTEGLKERGLLAEAAEESDLLVRTSTFQSVYTANVVSNLAGEAVRRKDYLRAADYYQRIYLILLQGGGAFLDTRAYVLVPGRAEAYRVRGHLAAGKLDQALEAYEAFRKYYPADVGLSIDLVRALEKVPVEWDRIYGEVRAVLKQRCADFPRSGLCHNQAAWFAARCGRDLDNALAWARRANELAPKHAPYLDTLAEVHYLKGEMGRAAEIMRECLRLDPKNAHYRAQLERFEGKGGKEGEE